MIAFKEEKNAKAQALGWPDYDTAIVEMYEKEELSYAQIARYFGMTMMGVGHRLKYKLGVTPRQRGGKNNPWGRRKKESMVVQAVKK